MRGELIETGDDFYKVDNIEEMVEEDEISAAEEGFMFGWLEAESTAEEEE
ncbi:hypothetical protein J4227_07875 [Candidatus Woesearchaeota archaeon]|nr:hypothetical protein [Candidatus Woesearchaeota archaeon]